MTANDETNTASISEQVGDQKRDRPHRRSVISMAGVGVALAAAGGLGVAFWPSTDRAPAEVVSVFGVDYTTNIDLSESGGYVYVQIPVNAETADIVLETGDVDDNATIRAFLGGLDTLVPGEHVLELSRSNLHLIVDGLADE